MIGLLITIGAFCIPPVRDFIIKKFQLSIDKALEDKKTLNERKNYISKVKFDAEFQIYRELSRDFFGIIKHVSNLIPYGFCNVPVFESERERDEYEKKIYKDAVSAYVIAQDNLNANAAFINEDFYQEYKKVLNLCNIQLEVFQQRWNKSFLGGREKKLPQMDDYNRTKEISDNFEKLNYRVREYISNLEVL